MHRDSVELLNNYASTMSRPGSNRPKKRRPAVTISQESGAGALTVAHLVAQRLDLDYPGDPPCSWAVFDRNLLTKTLEDHRLSTKIEAFMPEGSHFPLSEAFKFLLGLHPASWTLREYATDTIRQLTTNGNVILAGLAGAIITARLEYVLHVRLVAPFEFRVENYALSHGISVQQGIQLVRADDLAEHHYARRYFNTNVSNPLHYDLLVNTGRTGFERAARLICSALQDLIVKGQLAAKS